MPAEDKIEYPRRYSMVVVRTSKNDFWHIRELVYTRKHGFFCYSYMGKDTKKYPIVRWNLSELYDPLIHGDPRNLDCPQYLRKMALAMSRISYESRQFCLNDGGE